MDLFAQRTDLLFDPLMLLGGPTVVLQPHRMRWNRIERMPAILRLGILRLPMIVLGVSGVPRPLFLMRAQRDRNGLLLVVADDHELNLRLRGCSRNDGNQVGRIGFRSGARSGNDEDDRPIGMRCHVPDNGLGEAPGVAFR